MSSNLNAVEFTIQRILDELIASPFLMTKYGGGAPDTPGLDREREKLATIGERLKIAGNSLRSMLHMNALQAGHVHNLPREQRFGVRQGLASRNIDIQRVLQKAKLTHDLLGKAAGSAHSVHPLDAIANAAAGKIESLVAQQINGKAEDRPYETYAESLNVLLVSIAALIGMVIQRKQR